MKNYKSAILAMLTLALMFGIYSCNKDNSTNAQSYDMYDAPEWMIPEPDNSAADIVDATLETPFDLIEPANDCRFANQEMMGNKKFQAKRKFMPMAKILRSLNLDSIQREQVKDFVFDFRLCVKDAVSILRQTERDILAPFNEQREAIYTAYKNGELTRVEAQAQLKVLGQAARQALQDNGARILACESMKECRRILLESTRGILTEEQILKWDEWFVNLPVVDCNR